MRMIPKQEFTEELLDKYEIAHVLSTETIDSMISRGFIPFATNEVGDKIYNIDYYLENEDVFAAKLADFKNTRGYYTDSEFKKALVERDSSFESWAVNSFNQLAQRGLIRSDDIFEVQPKRVYLFSSSLIYNLESIKAALEELDAQLEAEEIDEFSLSLDEAEIEEDVSEEAEESRASQPEEEEFLEEDEDWEEEDDKQARRKKKRKEQEKIARERRIKEEQQRVADIARAEAIKAEERAAEAARAETARVAATVSEHKPETYSEHKSETYKSEPSGTSDSYSSRSSESKQSERKTTETQTVETATYKEPEKTESYSSETKYAETTHQKHKDEYRPTQTESYHPETSRSESYHSEHVEKSTKHEPEIYTPEHSNTVYAEEHRAETKREDVRHDYHSSSSEYYSQDKVVDSKPSDSSTPKSESYSEQRQSETTYKSQTEEEKHYSSTPERTTYQSSQESKPESHTSSEFKPETKSESYAPPSSAQQDTYAAERKREEVARAQYEAERRQAQSESKQESKPKPRGEDGTFTFTGTSIGKETASEHVETTTHEEARPAESYQTPKEYHKEESSQRSERTSEHKEKTHSSESYSAQNPKSVEKYEEYRAEKHEEYRPSTHEEYRPSERSSSTEQQSSRETERKTASEQTYISSPAETYKSFESHSEKSDSEKRTEQYDTPTDYRQSSYGTETRKAAEQSYTSSQTKATESRESYSEKSIERHESYSEKSDDRKPTEKHSDYSTPTETSYTIQEKQYKEEIEAQRNQAQRKEREASSDYSEQKREVHKENGYEFTGTSVGKDKYNTESITSEATKTTEGSQQKPSVSAERQESTSHKTEQKEAEHGATAEFHSTSKTDDASRSSGDTSGSYFDRTSEHSSEHRESGFSDKKEQSDKPSAVAEDVKPTQPTHSEPYKINVPLADGSYMTFEAQSKETQNKQSTAEQADESSQTTHKTSRENSTNGYDSYVTRAQAAYVSQGVVLSSEAINSIVAEVNSHSEGQGFKVSISRPSSDGAFKEDVVYDSQKKDSIGNIVDAYKEASRVDVLPTRTPEQEAKDNKVLFAVGLQAGGSVKDDTYTPPAVPTIHPRVFDELQQQGVKYVEVNGAKVNISDMSRISRTEFSVVENTTSYVNETVAKEQIAQATQFKYTPKIDIQQQNPAISYVKDAEKIVVAAADTRASFNSAFFIDSIKSAPEFVPAYLREVYTKETPKQEPKSGDDVKMKTINGFSSVRNLGSASDLRPNQSQSEYNDTTGGSFAAVLMPTMFRERKSSGDAAQRQADARQIGVATAVLDFSSVNIDFTKPETVEECARVVEEFQPELAKSLRATSKAINGDIASVLAGEADKVDGARLINRPETFIVGKAEYAEQIAAAIEDRYPENAARIRELSEQLNSPTSQLDTRKDIFRQFDINGKTSEEMVIKAQELLQDPHSFKGRAREIEQIASVVEETRGDIAKQLRQASRAQNGDIADVYTRAIRFERQINNPVPIANGQYQGKNNPQGKAPMGKDPSQGSSDPTGRVAVIKPGVNPNIKKHHRFGKLTSENIHATTKMTSLESRDEHGRKIIDVIEDNGDGTFNITHGYNTRDAVTVYNWAEGIENFDTSAIESAAMKKSKLARIATRNRKLVGAQFMTSKNAHFALNNSWVKAERKQHKVQHGEVNNMDDFTREIAQSTHMMYQQYQSGYNHPETWEELFDRHGFSGDGSVVKGLRGSELLKKQRRDALPKIASNVLMRAMPTQELNSTYLGTGYKYLLGRGSAVWTVGNIGAALDAKDRMRSLNRKVLTKELGDTTFSFVGNGKQYSFRSAKDRRALAKQLEVMSKASMGVNITRYTTASLNKMLRTGKDEAGKVLSAEQLDMVQATLRLRGISEGSLSVLSTYSYLEAHGLRPFDRNLSTKYKNVLNGKKIEELNKREIAALLERKDISTELRDALGWAQTLNGLTMKGKGGVNAALAAIDKAGLDVRFEDILKGRRISDLSTKQISILLKSNDVPDELKKLLQQTSMLRKLSDKRNKLMQTIGKLRQTAAFWGRKAVMQLRGTDLGDGIYALYSAVHTAKTAAMVVQGLRNYNRIMKASLRDWISRGKVGSLRHKIANTKRFKRKEAKKARKQAAARQRAQKRAAKQQKKLAKQQKRRQKRKDKFNKRHPKTSKRIKKAKKRTRKVANRLGRVGRRFGKVGRGVRKVVGTVLKPFKFVSGLINNVKSFLIKKFIMPFGIICIAFILAITAIEIGINAVGAGTSAVYSVIQFLDNDKLDESTGMDTEARLIDNTIELCINLDSAFKYYNEKFYTESTVVKAVKDAIKEDHEDECDEYYDPKENETLKLKRLGTTLNGIQTGIYYTYYNGDAKEIGFKSNAKDIASLANAWAGGDFHAKGLYKSYVEKLWNYTHVVAYTPRLQVGGDYNGKYVYACSSNENSSECYSNEYSYKCNDSSANVYETSWGRVTGVKANIKNGNDKASGKVNGSGGEGTTAYTVKNGIVEYNEHGCSTHKFTYHTKGTNVTAQVTGVSGKSYIAVSLSDETSNRISEAKIVFCSEKPCTNAKSIKYAVQNSSTKEVTEKTAYYCPGCCSGCGQVGSKSKTVNVNQKQTCSALQIGSCSNKKTTYHGSTQTINGTTIQHCLKTARERSGCSNQGTKSITTGVSKHSGTVTSIECNKRKKDTSKTYSVTCKVKPVSYKVGSTLFTFYYQNAERTLVGTTNKGYGSTTGYTDITMTCQAQTPSDAYEFTSGTPTYKITVATDSDLFGSYYKYKSCTYGGKKYYCDIVSRGILATSHSCDKCKQTVSCYGYICKGHDSKETYYYCKGHSSCNGHVASKPQNITINYCKGYCSGHTLEHYCTGHVDLNVAVVTLFLDDNNSMAYLGVPKTVISETKKVSVQDEMSVLRETDAVREVQTAPENAEYLYDDTFNGIQFGEFDYEKYPLPSMSVFTDFALDLKGDSVSDPGNFGNPLDTLRWNETFITDTVKKDESGKKTLNSVVSSLFSTFSTDGVWEDKNDGFSGFATVSAGNIANSYFKNFLGFKDDWGCKHHYFTGFFKYSNIAVEDSDGNKIKSLLIHTNADGSTVPVDNGPYARATEAVKEDWYETYGIVFPGAYNVWIEDEEIEKILANMTTCAAGESYQSYVTQNKNAAKQLLKQMGSTTSQSAIDFAADWFKVFYKNVKSASGTKDSQINTALSLTSGMNQTDRGKNFRKSLGVKSLKTTYGDNVETAIKHLHVGDLLGAGDEVYVVLYNDTNARTYPNGTNTEKRGINKGHVIVATVNGAEKDAERSDLDSIHMFSFTTEYISKKSELFWVYKCE